MTKETLCWSCSKGADECCFMESLEPVPNWKAKKVLCEGNPTYLVIKCPNFEPMRENTVRESKERTKPRNRRAGVKIRCVETGRVYMSIEQCAEDVHLSPSYVSQLLSGRRTQKHIHFEKV